MLIFTREEEYSYLNIFQAVSYEQSSANKRSRKRNYVNFVRAEKRLMLKMPLSHLTCRWTPR